MNGIHDMGGKKSFGAAEEMAGAAEDKTPSAYYEQWLTALESLAVARGFVKSWAKAPPSTLAANEPTNSNGPLFH